MVLTPLIILNLTSDLDVVADVTMGTARILLIMGGINAQGTTIANDAGPEYRQIVGCRTWIQDSTVTADGRLEILRLGINNRPDVQIAPKQFSELSNLMMGPEMAAAQAMVSRFPTEDVFLLKMAVGGSGFGRVGTEGRWFDTTGDLTIEFWARYDNLVAELIALGYEGTSVELLIIANGEQDSVDALDAAEYQTRLTAWIVEARAQTSEPELAVSISQLHVDNTNTGVAAVRTAQAAVATADSRAVLTEIDFVDLANDGESYLWSGQVLHGRMSVYNFYSDFEQTVVYEDYSVGDMKRRLKAEFGLDERDEERVVDLMNDAMMRIIEDKNSGWPWQMKEYSVNIDAKRTITGVTFDTVDQHPFDRRFMYVPTQAGGHPPEIRPRDFIQVGDASSTLTEGFMVLDVIADSGDTYIVVLDAKNILVEDTGTPGKSAATTITVSRACYPLPQDFLMQINTFNTTTPNRPIVYRGPISFEETRRQRRIASGNTMTYTIKQDPIPAGNPSHTERQFMCIYPYQTSLLPIRGLYTALPPKLILDGDLPWMPRQYRYVLYRQTAALVAGQIKESSQLGFYVAQAEQALSAMNAQYQFAEDRSELLAIGSHPLHAPSLPPEFENWRLC